MHSLILYLRSKSKLGVPYITVLPFLFAIIMSTFLFHFNELNGGVIFINFCLMLSDTTRMGDNKLSYLDYQTLIPFSISKKKKMISILISEIINPKIIYIVLSTVFIISLKCDKFLYIGITILFYLLYNILISLVFNLISRKYLLKRIMSSLMILVIALPIFFISQIEILPNKLVIMLLVIIVLLLLGIILFYYLNLLVKKEPFVSSLFSKKSFWF